MQRFLLLLLFSCSLTALQAQQSLLQGNIQDSEGLPIAFAHIYNVQQETGATTDELGRFRLSAKAGDSLRLSYIGFETRFVVVTANDMQLGLQATLRENTLLLHEIVVEGKYIPSMLAREKPQPIQIDGLPTVNNPVPITPGTARWGNDLWKTAPVQTLGPSATIEGPFSYFSKEAKEKRKFKTVSSRHEKERVYNALMGDPDTAEMLREKYGISQHCCDSLLLSFNQQHPEAATLKTEYQILERLFQFFRLGLGID